MTQPSSAEQLESLAVLKNLAMLMRCDAEVVAGCLRARAGERSDRKDARLVLNATFTLLQALPVGAGEVPSGEVDPDAQPQPSLPTPEQLVTAALRLQSMRKKLEDLGKSGLRPIRDVWVRSPFHEHLLTLVFVARRERLCDAIDRRTSLPLALSEDRVEWMEKRCNVEQPGVVRKVRVAENAESERLLSSELELIRKRGRSRFS